MKKKYIIKKARKLLVEQINSHQTIVRNDMNNIETMSNMKGLSEVIPKDNDGYCTIYKMDCADGLGLMTVYQVFPGIQLIYNDFEATEYEWESILDKDILEINHCREGREGSRLLSGSCLYLGEGDLSIHTMDNCASEMSFPLKHYRGISVVINLTTVSKNSPEILMEAGIDILAFRNRAYFFRTIFHTGLSAKALYEIKGARIIVVPLYSGCSKRKAERTVYFTSCGDGCSFVPTEAG